MRPHLHHIVVCKRASRQRGQSMTEFALMLPILLLLLFAIFDFGRMLFMYNQLSAAAREGARYGSLVGVAANQNHTPQYIDCAGIRQAVRDKLGLPVNLPNSAIKIGYDKGQGPIVFTCDSGPSRNAIERGDRVVVTVESSHRFVTPFLGALDPIPFSFTASRTILKSGTQVGSGQN
jgi:Flp pilus assembly protein TadG